MGSRPNASGSSDAEASNLSPKGGSIASWPERSERSAQIALIRLNDGAVEQFFPLDSDRGRAGVLDDGKTIWTFHAFVVFYRITG